MPVEHRTLCQIKDLGLVDYQEAYCIQQETVGQVINGQSHTLILCEHHPVFTLGSLATEQNFLFARGDIEKKGATILKTNRGGEVTFHGPGQLVIYPIFRLSDFSKDLKVYLNQLEQVAIDLLQHFGIVANRISGQRGVWVGWDKIASIGIGVRKWVSFHGMSINVNTDLSYFEMIKPCGLNVAMTTMAKLKGKEIDLKQVKKEVVACFGRHFNFDRTQE